LTIDNPIGRVIYILNEVLRKMSCCGDSNRHSGNGAVDSDEPHSCDNHLNERGSSVAQGGCGGCGRGYGFWILVAVFGGLILLRYLF
jgi:hypothetical protein